MVAGVLYKRSECLMEITDEIATILAKGQAKSGINPLAILDGVLSGNPADVVADGFGFSATTAAYAKGKRVVTKTQNIPLPYSYDQAIAFVKEAAARISRSLVALEQPPTMNPYIAYFSKGIMANPTVVVVEIIPHGAEAQAVITAITTKVGFIKGYSLNSAINKFTKLL